MNQSFLGRVGRIMVWITVAAWCCIPFVWFAFALMRSILGAPALPVWDGSALANLGIMVTLFSYGVWCSVGCIMGAGLDRAITVVESAWTDTSVPTAKHAP